MTKRGVWLRWGRGAVFFSISLLLSVFFHSTKSWADGPLPSQDPAAKQAELDAELVRLLAAESKDAADAFERGNRARARNELEGAAVAYEEAARLAPKSPHPLRRLCGVLSGQGRHDDAIARCREAIALVDNAINRSALSSALLEKGDRELAFTNAQLAFDGDKMDESVAIMYCRAALAQNDMQALERGASRLRLLAPDAMPTHYFGAIVEATKGNWSEAETELEAARAGGLPAEEADRMLEAIRSSEPVYLLYSGHLKTVGIGWLGTLLLLILGGVGLSAAALRSSTRLPAEKTGAAHGFDAFLRRAYKGLLWVACAYYYISIPLVLATVFAGAGGVVLFFVWLGRIPIKLVLLVGIVAFTTVWAVLKSLFVRAKDVDPGEPLDLAEHPNLRRVLHEVASVVGTRPVDKVFLTPGTEVSVLERGSALSRLRGRQMERCLVLGMGALKGMHLLHLKAVLAHEYGHFQNADTAGGGFALAVRRSLLLSAIAMGQSGVARWYNPAWWFVRGFFALFLRISQGASRLQEVLADRWAAFSYGASAFEGGLRHVITASAAFDARANAVLNEVVTQKSSLRNLYTYKPKKKPDADELERAVDEALNRTASPYDSHPSPADRFTLVHRLKGTPEPEDDGTLALTLLSDVDAIQRAMTRKVCMQVAAEVGISIPCDDSPKKARRKRRVRGSVEVSAEEKASDEREASGEVEASGEEEASGEVEASGEEEASSEEEASNEVEASAGETGAADDDETDSSEAETASNEETASESKPAEKPQMSNEPKSEVTDSMAS